MSSKIRVIAASIIALAMIGGLLLLSLKDGVKPIPLKDGVEPIEPSSHGTAVSLKATSPEPAEEKPKAVVHHPQKPPVPKKIPQGLLISGMAFFIEGPSGNEGSSKNTVTPLAGEEIRIRIRQGNRSSSFTYTTGPEGEFRLGDLSPGDSLIIFEHGDFRPVVMDASLLPGKPITGIEVIFEPGFQVWGEVLDLEEKPVRDAILEFYSLDGTKRAEVLVNSKGIYRTTALKPGIYGVRVIPRLLRAAWRNAPKRQITVKGGTANRFDFTAELGRVLDVLVIGKDGRGVPDIQVHFTLKTPERGISGVLLHTDENGKTVLGGLPAEGTLTLTLTAKDGDVDRQELDLEHLSANVRLRLER